MRLRPLMWAALLALLAACAPHTARAQETTNPRLSANLSVEQAIPQAPGPSPNSAALNTNRYYLAQLDQPPPDLSHLPVPQPNVPADLVPGCNWARQFAIANWTGPLPCAQPAGVPSGAPAPASGASSSSAGAPGPSDVAAESIAADPPTCEDIRGKVVLITGASQGIGRATAIRLAAAGARVIGTSRYPWRYPQPTNWDLYELDYTSDESVKRLIARVAATHGHIDFLYLNAGRQFVGDVANSDFKQFQHTIDTDFFGPLRLFQAALPYFPQQGYARVLITSSVESQYASPGYLPYSVSKHALQVLQEAWLSEHVSEGVQTNLQVLSILPGTVNTSLGYTVIYGCPELYSSQSSSVIASYNQAQLLPELAINPTPPLRSLIMSDNQWSALIPLFCRRYSLPLEEVYVNTAGGPDITGFLQGEAAQHKGYSCGVHNPPGELYGGAGPLGAGVRGYQTIGNY